MRSTPSLTYLPVPLCPVEVDLGRVPSVNKIELNCVHMLNLIA